MLRPRTAAYALATLALLTGWFHAGVADADHMERRESEVQHLRQQLADTQAWLTAYQSAYGELMTGLDRIERANARGDRRSQMQVRRILARTRVEAARYVDPDADDDTTGGWQPGPHDNTGGGYVGGVGQMIPNPAQTGNIMLPPPGQTGPQPMKSADYESLRRQIGNAYTSEIPALVAEVARTSYLTVDQLIGLMKASSFDATRVDIAAAFYGRVTDPDAWFRVYDALDYTGNREALRVRINPAAAQ